MELWVGSWADLDCGGERKFCPCRALNPCHDTRIDRSFSLSDNALRGNGFSSASVLPAVDWSAHLFRNKENSIPLIGQIPCLAAPGNFEAHAASYWSN
jgi:hypothetical protein